MESTLIHLAVAWLLFAGLIAYLITRLPKSYKLKFVLIPATFVLALYVGLTIPQLMGYPFPGHPTGEFAFMSSQVNKNKVTMLVKYPDGKMRLYSFRADNRTSAQIEIAQGETDKGSTVIGSFQSSIGDKFQFPGLDHSLAPLEIKAPHNFGLLPNKTTPNQ